MSLVPTRHPHIVIAEGTSKWRIRQVPGGYEVIRKYPDTNVSRVFFAEDPATAALHLVELNENLTDHAREVNRSFE